jgi:hypothetical protein
MERRALFSASAVAGLAASLWPHGVAEGATAQSQSSESSVANQRAIEALGAIEAELHALQETPPSEVESIRASQRTFLRAHGKFPDFIEVSLDVWEKLYDWLVRTRQFPLAFSRLPDGRYALAFVLTTVIMRHDMSGTFVSVGFDKDR